MFCYFQAVNVVGLYLRRIAYQPALQQNIPLQQLYPPTAPPPSPVPPGYVTRLANGVWDGARWVYSRVV